MAVLAGLGLLAGCNFDASVGGANPDATADPTGDGGGAAADAAGTAACDDPDIVLCMQFEDTTDDRSATKLAVTATGVEYADGHDGRAIKLDADSAITLPESQALDVTEITLEAWVKPDTSDGTNIVFDNQGQYALIVRDDKADCVVIGDSEFLNPNGGAVAAGEWTHIACTYDSTDGLRVFQDGAQVGSANADGDITTGGQDGSAVGEDHPNAGSKFVGMIDSLRLWKVARAPNEVCPDCQQGAQRRRAVRRAVPRAK